mmetsp:Transcript_27528/g.72704  ORF Transcript_27528/g.72704 Transcript_27528/m.72704 type:complete len:200 (-) Transcript_27528:622-1221(-)
MDPHEAAASGQPGKIDQGVPEGGVPGDAAGSVGCGRRQLWRADPRATGRDPASPGARQRRDEAQLRADAQGGPGVLPRVRPGPLRRPGDRGQAQADKRAGRPPRPRVPTWRRRPSGEGRRHTARRLCVQAPGGEREAHGGQVLEGGRRPPRHPPRPGGAEGPGALLAAAFPGQARGPLVHRRSGDGDRARRGRAAASLP